MTAPSDSARRVNFLLGRLTVLRSILRTEPVTQLSQLCDAIAAGDAIQAAYKYHALTAALLDQSYRRVTGDIWKDCIFSELLETPSRFSVLASEGRVDPPVKQAMTLDMRIMQELFKLSSDQFIKWISAIASKGMPAADRPRRTDRDGAIERLALSAWNGGAHIKEKQRTLVDCDPKPSEALPSDLQTEDWATWAYSDPGERITYIADDGLAVIYRRFIAEKDWGSLIDELTQFHRKYGCGQFLRYRIFVATDEGMLGLEEEDVPYWDELACQGKQKETLYANTLRFMHTGKGENVLLYGAEGMGKTSLVTALTRELPELRLIFLAQRDFASSLETIRSLEGQPFKFISFMDDLSLSEREYRRLKATFATRRGPSNALVYATAPAKAPDGAFFTTQIAFAPPSYEEFSRFVSAFAPPGTAPGGVEAGCRAWRDDGGDLSMRAAKRVARSVAQGL